jgi:hypothetical protein
VAKNALESTLEKWKIRGWFFGNSVCFVLVARESVDSLIDADSEPGASATGVSTLSGLAAFG